MGRRRVARSRLLRVSGRSTTVARAPLAASLDPLRTSRDPAPDAAGAMVIGGRFRVVRSLGHGGMARVYLCTYLTGCLVAVKCLGREHRGGASREELDERFARESEILLSLRHPSIVAAYTHGRDVENDLHYLVMEYVPGVTLAEIRRRRGRPLKPAEAAELLLPIADALAYCHDREVYHRDVTPSNVLVARDRGVHCSRLVDFGTGWRAGLASLTGPVVFGNFDFQPLERMAPDHRSRSEARHQAAVDIYGLGAVAYFLTGGDGPDGALLSLSEKLGTQPLRAGGDAEWTRIVQHALAHDPEARLPSMALFRDALQRWIDANELALTEPYQAPYWSVAATVGAHVAVDAAAGRGAPAGEEPTPSTRPVLLQITNPLAVRAPGARRRAWGVLAGLTVTAGVAASSLFALGVLAAGTRWRDVEPPVARVTLPAVGSDDGVRPMRVEIVDPRVVAVRAARSGLSAMGIDTRAYEAEGFLFGDPGLHVPTRWLEPEFNWPGRTLRGLNPDHPWIALSPPHEVAMGAFEIAERPLTWSAWQQLGGSRPTAGPCASADLADPVGCLQPAEIAAVLNAASLRWGLDPAMDPVRGSWNGSSNGLRLPTEAEWERAALAGSLQAGGQEWVVNGEPLPDMPGPGAGVLTGMEVTRDVTRGARQRSFQRPSARDPGIGARIAWTPDR